MSKERLYIFDTTLRDGAQTQGVHFSIDEKTIIKRIKSRALIEGREDDNEQVIKTRISKYDKETKPVCNFYAKKYPDQYLSIDGSLEIDNLNKLLEKSLKNPLN